TKKEPTVLEVGQAAPDFQLETLDGHKVQLSDYKGKVVLLNFWATWCPPCRQEIPSMMRLNQAMAGKPFQMVAVSEDAGGKEAVEGYFKESGTALPALLDTDQAVAQRYGLTGVPETFVIDAKGVILKKVVGAMDWSDPNVIGFLNGAMK
ncbi:MAG TPA: TlpA disulfide reductase family protein, partial [Geobacteraceae bacterium]|nr:TlpA disulfide reductase family protein [Geobacteraceae bacterium]